MNTIPDNNFTGGEAPSVDQWLLEKSGNALQSLAQLVDFVHADESIASTSRESILIQIGTAASQITKVMSSTSGLSTWSAEDGRILAVHGSAGYQYLMAKYQGRGEAYVLGWDNYWRRLEPLIDAGHTSRSAIFELTRFTLTDDYRFNDIPAVVESLVMGRSVGKISWRLCGWSVGTNAIQKEY